MLKFSKPDFTAHGRMFAELVLTLFVLETLVMFLLPVPERGLHEPLRDLANALLLALFCSPVLLAIKSGRHYSTGDTVESTVTEEPDTVVSPWMSAANCRPPGQLTMENLLRHALSRNELLLHYQPKVNLRTGRITSMEALLRWQSPELGMVSPADFIPLAEETGLIEPIGEWVIRTACRQNRIWQAVNVAPLTVAVNISARQFMQQNLVATVRDILLDTGLAPHYLELELTESMVMHNADAVAVTLNELKELGVSLAMDDFGTGYSSLSCLQRFPFDHLKIDRSFVKDITTVPGSAAIARTVISMAHNLRMKVIAEGVETEGQLNYLLRNECDEFQGYYFSRPLPAAEFELLLREGRCLELSSRAHLCPERTILIVDDEPEVAEALSLVLARDGYHTHVAASAMQGFELLAKHQVAVILADQRMPGMSGSEFLGRVTELYPDTVRMVISGFGDLDSVTTAINCGAIYKYLLKPWKADDIRMKIDDAFRYYKSLHDRTHNLLMAHDSIGMTEEHLLMKLSA
jgi:EAL domain-containing protein (putative c-di-GMP-specific phosphodiesterase class I)/CheY-like chemotaxis protein